MLITPLGQRISVRFARKPIWMPTAPSKLFRIPDHKFYSKEEVEQIKVLQTALKFQEETIRQYMREEFYLPATKAGGLPDSFIVEERRRDEIMKEKNDKENDRVRLLREEAFKEMFDSKEKILLDSKLEREEELLRIGEETDEYIDSQKKDSNNFVTKDNIDELIDKALDEPTSHEFFIDKSGQKYCSNNSIKNE